MGLYWKPGCVFKSIKEATEDKWRLSKARLHHLLKDWATCSP